MRDPRHGTERQRPVLLECALFQRTFGPRVVAVKAKAEVVTHVM